MAPSDETLKLLSQLIGTIGTAPQQNQSLAKSILLNSQINYPAPNYKASGSGGPSVVSRIFDILSRPNYAVANEWKPDLEALGRGDFKGFLNDINPIHSAERAWQGLSGKQKTTFTDLALNDKDAQRAVGISNFPTPVRAGIGFAADILGDPTTYVGPGAIKGLFKGGKALVEAPKLLKGIDTITKAGVDAKTYDQALQKAAIASTAKEAAAATPDAAGSVQRAEQLVTRVGEMSPQALHTVMPKPPPVGALNPLLSAGEKAAARDVAKNVLVNAPKATKFDPSYQMRIWKQLLEKTTGTPQQRWASTLGMLRQTEKVLEAAGHRFKYWDGTELKLSDLFTHMGEEIPSPDTLRQLATGKVTSPILDQAIEALRANSAMKDAPMLGLGLDNVTRTAAASIGSQTPSVSAAVLAALPKELKLGLQGAGASEAAVKTGAKLFEGVVKSVTPAAQLVMNATVPAAHAAMRGVPKVLVDRQGLIDKAIAQHLESPYRTVATTLGDRNKALEFMGERFQAHYGYSALRPMAQDALLSAQSNAARQAKIWSSIVKATTKTERGEALTVAQRMGIEGALPENIDPKVMQVAQVFRDQMDRLFARTGIEATAQSVATRAAFTMKDMNKELKNLGSKFTFTNKVVDDHFGRGATDYSKGVDWLKSWESHVLQAGEDPIELMDKLTTAAERVSKKYSLMDEAAARFGTTTRTGPFQYLVADARLAGHYFPKETAVQMNKMLSEINKVHTTGNPFVHFVDRVTSAWKSGVTIYAPSHYIRNMIGDSWLSWIAGVNTPKPYYQAVKVLRANAGKYAGSIDNVEKLVSPEAFEKASVKPGTVVTKTRSGIPLSAEQIYIAAHQRGLLLPARQLQDIYAEPLLPKVFGGKVQAVAHSALELQEHYIRLGHFIDVINKSHGKDIKSVLDEAAHQVRKWHPDGMDLSGFEQKYMRRIFPFYSWTRKAFPLVFESMISKPGKVIAYPKAMTALQGAMGIQAGGIGDPFPSDQLFPNWMKEKGIGPVGATAMGGIGGLIGNLARQGADKSGNPIGGYALLNPSNPMIDLVSQFAGMGNPRAPLQGLGSSLNPLARIPIELGTDKQLFTDVPVSYDPNRYATEQIPGGGILSRLTNLGIGGPTVRGQREGLGNQEALLNYLFGLGLQGTGPYITQAQREQQGQIAKQRQKEIQRLINGSQ